MSLLPAPNPLEIQQSTPCGSVVGLGGGGVECKQGTHSALTMWADAPHHVDPESKYHRIIIRRF